MREINKWIYFGYFIIYGYSISEGSVNLAFKKPAIKSSPTNPDYSASNAVDENTSGIFGFIGSTFGLPGYGTCVHTQVMGSGVWTPVYWEVDLGSVSIITQISITYRSAYPQRLNGYTIKVSDQSLIGGTVCFQDTAPGNPPTYAIHQCTAIGRYARYENSVGYAELCNFEAYGCPVTFYGNNCQVKCSENCSSPTCNPVNGHCIGGCKPGFKGPQCNEVCEDGTFGSGCLQQCYCRDVVCDKVNGTCPGGCQKGWSGPSCSQPCTSGRFGYDCMSQCNCQSIDCEAINGTCFSGRCLPGWTLDSCSEKCPANTYGQDCSERCGKCRNNEICNHVKGTCENGCSDGWLGPHCNISCDPGMYGRNCSRECGNCLNETYCNNENGHCPRGLCDFGYRGETCKQECSSRTYGRNCLLFCGGCFNSSCSKINGTCLQGCAPGFSDSLCQTSLLNSRPQSNASSVAIPVVLSFLVIAGVGLGIVLVMRRRTQRRRNEIKYTQPLTKRKKEPHEEKRKSLEKSNEVLYANSPDKFSSIEKSEKESHENLAYSDDAIYSNETEEDMCTDTLILVKDLKQVIEEKREKKFEEEYKQLPVGLQFPHEHGKDPNNKAKNRFLGTFPYDHNRVVLPVLKGVENSDYINASYIDGLDTEKAYIATQGPKKGTILDFWRMVWKLNVDKIVMVTNLIEGAKTKCEKYWPDENEHLNTGYLIITTKKEIKYAAFTKREIRITSNKSDKERLLYQFHFTQWPDHDTPDTSQLLHFQTRVEQIPSTESGPIVVHCSAGIGRTGTFIALNELLKHGRKMGSVDAYQYTKLMRKGRMNMIQTLEQYKCLHETLLEGFTYSHTAYLKEEFSTKRKELLPDDDIPINQSELWNQYEILKSIRPTYDDSCYTDGTKESNLWKNRDTSIVAHNRYRLYLTTYPSDSTDYINAVTIPSYQELCGFITTNVPLPNTVENFWSMVYDHDAYCIVLLDAVPKDVFLAPPVNEYMQLKTCVVYSEREFHRSESITDMDIILSPQNGNKDQERRIKIYMNTSEESNIIPDSTELFVSLCECVIDSQRSQSRKGPIVLACRDSASKCGMFATMVTSVQRIMMDKDIDIFLAVKTIQQRRTQFVNSVDQYKYIHELIEDYMDSNQLYVNV